MFSKKQIIRACAAFGVVAAPAIAPVAVHAQDSTTGAISGTVKDKATGELLPGVTIVITSVERKNDYNAMTGSGGSFKVSSLPPGDYSVLLIYGDTKSKMNVRVNIGKSQQLYPKLDLSRLGGETVTIRGRALIDTTKTTQGIVINKSFTENLPVPGHSFEGALETAAGAEGDGVGVSFSGSSSLENQYVVDGVNTTGLGYGTVGSPVINEFVEEIEVITGGYMAEHGRSTGGVVNVVTQSGSNDFHGAVFTKFTNSLLQKRNEFDPIESWVDIESNLVYDWSVGATLSGPIIKDKLWFFVGIAPRFIASDTERITKRQTDCRVRMDNGDLSICDPALGDGDPDVGDDGFRIYDELDRSTKRYQATEYQFVSKVNYTPTPEHAGQVTFSGTPNSQQNIGIAGETQAVSRDVQVLTTDVSAKWTSKLNDAKTTVEGIVGVHRSTHESGSVAEVANSIPQQVLQYGNFGDWAAGTNQTTGLARETPATILGCRDSADEEHDPYQNIENCPDSLGIGYAIGGIGFLEDEEEQRTLGRVSVTQRMEAAGSHEIKGGVDLESNFLNKKRLISGDVRFINRQGLGNTAKEIEVFRYVAIAPEGDDSGNFPDSCGRGTGDDADLAACNYHPSGDVKGRTLNFAGFLQDSWRILPNLTFNAGMRYEEQRLRHAEHLRGTVAVGTGETLGKNAMKLGNMWAPRIGMVYDWTKEGRSKVYGSWGRYYESIPMDINDRSFGGESWMRSSYDPDATNNEGEPQCGDADPNLGGSPSGENCITSGQDPANGDELTGAGVLVATGLEAQYLDEAILGIEYEVMEDLKLSLSYKNRTLGRVLEDLSTDNAKTYILANPGSWSIEEEEKLLEKIENETGMDEPDLEELVRLNNQLNQFRGIREFDAPRRDYNAVEATLTKRFSRKFMVQSSYTYSKTEGNYQGLFSSNNGQIDPNITSLFDLPELMANRDGALPQDRPHSLKFDGYYVFDFKEAGELTTGLSFRALSGTPRNATGAHYRYGRNETMVLPRGAMGRTDFNTDTSVHLGYKRDLGKGMELEVMLDFFHVTAFDFLLGQKVAAVDDVYTRFNVNPVVGGSYEDLVYLKELDQTSGAELGEPVRRNRNFGNPLQSGRYAAPAARLGARLKF
ncbi:MAG: TonB-dependent receptor [Myxococcales bacterium]|nr:TonB-dependent receptor [Myxococcales bacterium]